MDSIAKSNEKFVIVREPVEQRSPTSLAESDSDWSEPPPPMPPCGPRGDGKEWPGKGVAGRRLEAELCATEMDRLQIDEKLRAKRERLRRLEKVLEAQALFCQSADLKARALAKLSRATADFARRDLPSSAGLDRALEEARWQFGGPGERLAELAGVAGAGADPPGRLCRLLADLREKKKDLRAATGTLRRCLRTADAVTAGKCRRSEMEYRSSRESYERSCVTVGRELSKLIEDRRGLAATCFEKMAPLQETTIEQDKQLLALWREVSEAFEQARDRAGGSSS